MAHDAFVSYSTKDKPVADAVCATLEANGIRCWIAPRDILPGMDWGESIIDAINESRVMILVFSASANASPQIKREVERAVNKAIPIIPFRIEDVPLSKSLEYFISTPHWLDALSQPMERHLQYLSQTVGLLLDRNPREGAIPRMPPAAAATKAPSNQPYWIIPVAIFVLLLLSGLIYLGIHFLKPDPVNVQKESAIDPAVVGNWHTNPVINGKAWTLQLDITAQETFQLKSRTEDNGTYSAQGGRWRVQAVNGDVDGGPFQILNQNSMSMTGKGGTAIWTRVGQSESRSPRLPSLDPFVVGVWKTNATMNGIDFELLFEMASNGSYRVTSTTEDSGTFEAKNGRCKQISRKGPVLDCTYQTISADSISLTGPLGTAVWTRS